jgi:hypothetical protein
MKQYLYRDHSAASAGISHSHHDCPSCLPPKKKKNLQDAVNMSARLMASAAGGNQEVVVDEDTLAECGKAIEFQTIPGIKVKGREKPITVHKPLKEASKLQKQDQGSGPRLFVGRQQEVSEIAKCVQDVACGNGRFVCIEGRGGLGKSAVVAKMVRLCEESKLKPILIESPEFERNTVCNAHRPSFIHWKLMHLYRSSTPGRHSF